MENRAFKAWAFQDDHDRLVGTMNTEQLRQVLEVDLPKTLPQKLPMLFPTAEVAEAYGAAELEVPELCRAGECC